jgi:hypothetical protein
MPLDLLRDGVKPLPEFLVLRVVRFGGDMPFEGVQVVEREHHRPGGRRGTQGIQDLIGQAVPRIEENPFRWGQPTFPPIDLLLPGHGLPSCETDPCAMDRHPKPSSEDRTTILPIGSIAKSALTVQ